MYEKILEHLGEKWLKGQIRSIELGTWIPDTIPKANRAAHKNKFKKYGYFVLAEIERLLLKFESVEGFPIWVSEARSNKNFGDNIFELLCLDDMLNNSKVALKVNKEKKIPEAFIESQGKAFYVEMRQLSKIPGNYVTTSSELIKKARRQFMGGDGILFVGISIYDQEYIPGKPKLTKPLKLLIDEIQSRRRLGDGKNKNILAVIFVYSAWNVDSGGNVRVPKDYLIVRNPYRVGDMRVEFISKLLGVKDVYFGL
jgi:hypothetical protein